MRAPFFCKVCTTILHVRHAAESITQNQTLRDDGDSACDVLGRGNVGSANDSESMSADAATSLLSTGPHSCAWDGCLLFILLPLSICLSSRP